MDKIRRKLIVLSGKGGVGKSTVAVNLAAVLSEQAEVGLLDVDIHGPSVPKLLDLKDARPLIREGVLYPIPYSKNLRVMSIGLLVPDNHEPIVWRGPLKAGMIGQFLADVEWGEPDYLVIDSPPGTGDEPLSVLQLIGDVDGAIVVTTPQDLALEDVARCISFCRMLEVPILGIVENMSGFVCPHCGGRTEIFQAGGGASLAAECGLPYLGSILLEPAVVKAGDSGKPFVLAEPNSEAAVSFRRIVEEVCERLESRG